MASMTDPITINVTVTVLSCYSGKVTSEHRSDIQGSNERLRSRVLQKFILKNEKETLVQRDIHRNSEQKAVTGISHTEEPDESSLINGNRMALTMC